MPVINKKRLNLSKAEELALGEFVKYVKTVWPSSRFKVFGSKAAGFFDAESDLDLLVTLPCPVTKEIRQRIIYEVFDINLNYGTNVSALIVSEKEWQTPPLSLLPIHFFVEDEGISL